MKHIKTFENSILPPISSESKLHSGLCKFLSTIDSSKFEVKKAFYERGEINASDALTFNVIKQGVNKNWDSESSIEFSIRILPVSDKKLREETIRSKLKVTVNSCYYQKNETSISVLNFVKETLKRFCYFQQDFPSYTNSPYAARTIYYINSSNIDNIEKDLNENFEYYMDTKKYNL